MNFFNKLQSREKLFLSIMIFLVITVAIYSFFSKHLYQSSISKIKLEDTYSDYKYVLNRYRQIEKSINSKLNSDKSKLSASLETFLLSKPIQIFSIKEDNNDLVIDLESKNLSSLTNIINELNSKYDLPIKKINFYRNSDLIKLEIVVD